MDQARAVMEIEQDIPIPLAKGNVSFVNKYPFRQMKVGESVLVTDGKQSRVCNAAGYAGLRHRMKFTTRSVMINGAKCTRVWRIA